jgi:GNAT superfamily N-acetyltransferase
MIIDATGLFPSDMLDDMLVGYFNGDASEDFWLTIDEEGLLAIAFYVPERMTQGTWNLLLIAVHPDNQRHGYGSALLHHFTLLLQLWSMEASISRNHSSRPSISWDLINTFFKPLILVNSSVQ